MQHGCVSDYSDCATPASAPAKEGTRAAIVHSQPPARRGSIVSVSSIIISDRASRSKSSSLIFFGLSPLQQPFDERAVNDRDRMRTNVTPAPVLSIYLSIILLVILVFVNDKAYAKRGCAAFGHSCFGGHGKRFDSTVPRNALQESMNQNIQESEVPSPNDELFYVLPNDEFRERSDQPFMRTSKGTKQFDVYPLSSLVDQWIASHRRQHRTDTDITDK